jgi:hypothetical protein
MRGWQQFDSLKLVSQTNLKMFGTFLSQKLDPQQKLRLLRNFKVQLI